MKRTLTVLAANLFLNDLVVKAAEYNLESPRNTGLIRFEIDNDVIWDEDSNFSNGWSLQYNSKVFQDWDHSDAPESAKWIGKHIVGLTREDAVVRMGHGVGQNMITPGDLSRKEPLEGDLPYAGSLTYSLSWQSFNADSVRSFQVSLGIMGEGSQAEQFQKFVHNDLGLGDYPQGWNTQRETEPIMNFGYFYGQRLLSFGNYDDDLAGQVSWGAGTSLGNLFTAAETGLSFRGGWNIPQGFNAYPAPPGRGHFQSAQLPKPVQTSPHGFEYFMGIRSTALLYSVIYDGSLITGDDRDVERRNFVVGGIVGFSYHFYDRLAMRISVEKSSDLLDDEEIPPSTSGFNRTSADVSFGSLIFDYHF